MTFRNLISILLMARMVSNVVGAPEHLSKSTSTQAERLPTDLTPSHYRLYITPFLEENNFTTDGSVTIRFSVKKSTDKVVINIFDMEIDKKSVKLRHLNTSTCIGVIDQQFNDVSQTYTITLEEALQEGNMYEVEVKFTGHLRDNMQGFYRSHYVDPRNNLEEYMASTQFSPIDARRAFPCFDEPSFKAKFTISVGRPSNMSSISNMPKETTSPMISKINWEWDHYRETPVMSTYLIAFVVSDLIVYKQNTDDKIQFSAYTRMNSADQVQLMLDLCPKILKYYENYFNVPFPLPKIDLVAVPDFGFNAMENWGLITFRETAMLFDENSATIDDKKSIVTVLAHEVAHQWFGNLVTPAWWNDLWLKEGFSNFLRYYAVQEIYPTWNLADEFVLDENYAAFELDYFESSRPVTLEVVSADIIRQMFDSISYSKGAAVIRMLSHIVGEEVFKQSLIQYLHQYKYSNANHDELWTTLGNNVESNVNMSIKQVMDSWILQPGFPVVNAVRNKTSGEVHLQQERFLFSNDNKSTTLWWIPLSYTSDLKPNFEDTKPKFWINNVKESVMALPAQQWWILNLQQTGYYIVNYDDANWKSLTDNIMSFPSTTRVQLLSDSMDLAKANLLIYDIPLKMLTNIALNDKEITFVTHRAAFAKITFIHRMLSATPIYNKFVDFIFQIFDHAFTTVDFNDLPTDDYLVQRTRKLITKWACTKSANNCTTSALNLFQQWAKDPINHKIRPNLQEVVFCTSIREGGETEWNLLYNHYTKSNSIYEKNIILDSLGCSRQPSILNRYLDLVLQSDSPIRKQDSSRVFKSVANNPVGYTLAFSYLERNWKELNNHFGSAFSIVSKMVAELPHYMNTRDQLAQLENFKTTNINDLGTSSQAIDRVIETVKINIKWMDESYALIENWLNENVQM